MGTFDPNTFLDATMTEANSTESIPCPEGEYIAVANDEPAIRQFSGVKDPTKTYTSLDIVWTIEDPQVAEITKRSPTKVRQSLMLDMGQNGLDMGPGKNIGLGRLREAVGLNVPGKPFSFRQLQGVQALVKVTNRTDGERVFDEVKSVAPAR
jgi:hypothetical protein